MEKIKPYTPQWEQLANQVARDFAPTIRPCVDCGRPVANGYCCTHCGSVDPNRPTKPNVEAETSARSDDSSPAPCSVADRYELHPCDKCFQMTNHLDGVCQKCKQPNAEAKPSA